MKWKPIETAPKDQRILAYGTLLFAMDIRDNQQRIFFARYRHKRYRLDEVTGRGYQGCHVTHWMPLPEPPKGGE